jgi:hypothetical protein
VSDHNDDEATLRQLARGNKMIRLGLACVNEDGELVPTPAMDDMDDGPVEPDEIDFDEVRRRHGPGGGEGRE